MSSNGHQDKIEGRVNKELFDMMNQGQNPIFLDDNQGTMNIAIPLQLPKGVT